jgi:hypothetical protein
MTWRASAASPYRPTTRFWVLAKTVEAVFDRLISWCRTPYMIEYDNRLQRRLQKWEKQLKISEKSMMPSFMFCKY